MVKKQPQRKTTPLQFVAFMIGFYLYSSLVWGLIILGVILPVSLFFSGRGLTVQLQVATAGFGLIALGILPTALLSKKLFGKRQFFITMMPYQF